MNKRMILAILTLLMVGLLGLISSDLLFAISLYENTQPTQIYRLEMNPVDEKSSYVARQHVKRPTIHVDTTWTKNLQDWFTLFNTENAESTNLTRSDHDGGLNINKENLPSSDAMTEPDDSAVSKLDNLYVQHNSLTDISTKDFIINGDTICGSDKVDIVTVVHSAVSHKNKREMLRKSWTKPNLKGVNTRLAFILGRPGSPADNSLKAQQELAKEVESFGDIVQADFIDTYRNLSTKNIFGNLWASEFCHQAELVVKTDDDTFIDLYALHHITRDLINSTSYKTNQFMLCPVRSGLKIVRIKKSKWYVSYGEWSKNDVPEERLPSFCTGNFHATNPGTAKRLVEVARNTKVLSLEDVWVSGYLVSRLNFKHLGLAPNVHELDAGRLFRTKSRQSTDRYHDDYLFGTVLRLEKSKKLHQMAEACYVKKCKNNFYNDYKKKTWFNITL